MSCGGTTECHRRSDSKGPISLLIGFDISQMVGSVLLGVSDPRGSTLCPRAVQLRANPSQLPPPAGIMEALDVVRDVGPGLISTPVDALPLQPSEGAIASWIGFGTPRGDTEGSAPEPVTHPTFAHKALRMAGSTRRFSARTRSPSQTWLSGTCGRYHP